MNRGLGERQKGVKGHPNAQITQELVYKTTPCKTNQTPEHKPRECIKYPTRHCKVSPTDCEVSDPLHSRSVGSVPYCAVLAFRDVSVITISGVRVLTCPLRYRATVFHSQLTAGSVGQENLSNLTL